MNKLLNILLLLLLALYSFAASDTTSNIEQNPTETLQTSKKMASETRYVVMCLERGHYLKMPVKDLDIKEFIREYMSSLDFLKLFFIAEDLQHYQDLFSPSVDIMLHQGVLLPAYTIYAKFTDRATARLAWIKARMEKPFDFDALDTFNPDRSKAEWPKNAEEADELWDKRLRFDIINQMVGYDIPDELDEDSEDIEKSEDSDEKKEEAPKTFDEKFAKAKEEVLKRYERVIDNVKKSDAMEVQEIFLNSLAAMYDPHSSFLSEYYLEEFDISVKNALIGIGAMLQEKDGYCRVAELIPGGPAEKSGQIKAGDRIVGVAEGDEEFVDVIGGKLRNTVRLIRGKAGTKVRLSVEPGGNPAAKKVVTIVREEIQLTTKLAKAYIEEVPEGDNKTVAIGVIDIPAFYGETPGEDGAKGFSTTKDVEELINKLKAKGVKGIVLDLRRNGGGFLNESIDLAGLFIRTGPVLQVRDANGRINQLRDDNPKVVWDGPLIILVSRLSASASEILAGALQNHEKAIIVGDKITHGKGTVQAVLSLSNLDPTQKSAAKVTIQKWYTPLGDSIQVRGIKSDIELPSLYDFLDLGEDKKDNALPWDSIEPASIRAGYGYGEGENGKKLVEYLKEKSIKRQAESEEIKFLNEKIDWMKSRKDKKDWSLSYSKREEEMKSAEAFAKDVKKREKEYSKLNFKTDEIALDSVIAKEKESEELQKKNGEAENNSSAEVSENGSEKKLAEKSKNGKKKKDSDKEKFDIQMRESLRIMADWLQYLDDKQKAEAKVSQN